MSGKGYHLAQFNIGRMLAPIDDPVMEGFRSQLEPINALADRSPGFVWRLQTESGDATAVRAYADPLMIVNLSVWESLDGLHAFVYKSRHLGPSEPILVLWWVPKGHIPSVEEAMDRLGHLRLHGPNPTAFTFRAPFPAPGPPEKGVRYLFLEKGT
jgi:Domain of unknown function (DUF3291)